MPLPDRRGYPYITPYDGAAAGGGCARIRNRRPARPTAGLPAVGFLALVRAPLMAPEQGGGGRVGLYAGYARAGAGLVPLACHYGWSTGVTSGHQAYLLACQRSLGVPGGRTVGLRGGGHEMSGLMDVSSPDGGQLRGTTPLPARASARRWESPLVRTRWAW